MKGKTRMFQEYILASLSLTILVILLFNSAVFFIRIDLTENRMFTISEVSKRIISDIPQDVTITYYISQTLKRYSPVPSQIEDLLYEYAAYARENVHIKSIDTTGNDAKVGIEHFGFTPRQIQIVEKDEKSSALVYSGIVIEYLDRSKFFLSYSIRIPWSMNFPRQSKGLLKTIERLSVYI